jgi:hypothetical protein
MVLLCVSVGGEEAKLKLSKKIKAYKLTPVL